MKRMNPLFRSEMDNDKIDEFLEFIGVNGNIIDWIY